MTEEVWNLERDLCRCCHSEGSYKNLYTPYFSLGVEEMYGNMLRECLDIELVEIAQSHECGICDVCIQTLQDAAQFKRQVQDCEIRFRNLYRNENISVLTKRLKHKTKTLLSKVKEKNRKVGRPKKHTVLLKNNEIEIGYDKEEKGNSSTNKKIGYNSNYRRRFGLSNKSAKGHCYNSKNNREIDYNNKDMKEICYSNITIEEFGCSNKNVIEDIGFSSKNIEEISYMNKDVNENGSSTKNIGEIINKKNMREICYNNKSMEDFGSSNKNMEDIGYSNNNIKEIGYKEVAENSNSTKNIGDIINNKNMREICYSNNSMEEFGPINKNMEDIGSSNKNREDIGYSKNNMKEIGYKQVAENGYSTKNIGEIFNNKNMKEICYSNNNIEDIDSSNKNMEDIGYSNKNIEDIGYSDNLLKNYFGNGNNDTIFCEYDSDTPISRFSKEYAVNKNTFTAETVKSDLDGLNESSNLICKAPQYRVISGTKLVSERKRIRLTCETVLKDTSACPFRHHRSWFRCFYCMLDFMDIDKLRQHTVKSHNEEDIASIKIYPRTLQIDISDFRCKICNENLTDIKEMIEHFLKIHEKVVYKECIADYKVNTSPYTCHLCRKQYHVFRTLTTHLNEHYANCICDVCGKPFLNSKRLKVHKRTHETGNFPCSECGKVLKTKTSIANHMESHSKRILKCHICAKPMKHYNDRIKHMSEAHNITHTFKCVICGREYNIKHYLATHMRQTHGHKNKKCLECGMAFITNHGLKKHMLKHTGEKAFPCTICSKAYARSYSLKEHMRVHESEKADK